MSRDIAQVADLDDALVEQIADMGAEGWDQDDGRFDWEAFLSRVERTLDVDLPTQMTDPVIRKVQRIAKAAAREASV